MISKLKQKLKLFKQIFSYKTTAQKIMFSISTVLIIDATSFISQIIYNEAKFHYDERTVGKYFSEKKVNFENIKEHNSTSVKFIESKGLYIPYIILDDKYGFKQEALSPLSISMNLEKTLTIPYTWQSKVDFITTPERGTPTLLLSNLFKKENLNLILYGVLILILLRTMPISNNKFEIVYPADIDGNMSDLVGLDEELKSDIMQLKDMIENSTEYAKRGVSELFNIMFSGPPGTGKTRAVSYLAKELQLPMIVGTGNVETGFIGGGVSTIKALFENAESAAYQSDKKTAILFLDEAQVLFMKRGSSRDKWADDAANELLAQLDGVKSKREVSIIFIVASNFDNSNIEIDEAMARRFKRKIFFRLPNLKERKEIINYYLDKIDKNYVEEIEVAKLAEISDGLSPAIISNIINEAFLLAIRKRESVTNQLLFKSFEKISIGHTTRDITKEHERKRVIIHELGHFIAEYEERKEDVKTLKISSEAVSQYKILGFVMNRQDLSLKTRRDLEEEIIHLYGGLVAESVFFSDGNYDNVSVGAYNDIEKISEIMKTMVVELGMYSNMKVNLIRIGLKNEEDVIKTLGELSERLLNESKRRVEVNVELIKYLKDILIQKWALERDEIFEYIKLFKERNDGSNS